jgi:hypothetical protein
VHTRAPARAATGTGARSRAITGTTARRCGQNNKQAQCYEDCYELFHGVGFSYSLYANRLCCSLFYGSL